MTGTRRTTDPSGLEAPPGAGAPLLGRNPFEELGEPDPFLERVHDVKRGQRGAHRSSESCRPPATLRTRPEESPSRAPPVPLRKGLPPTGRDRRAPKAPRLSESELPPLPGWSARWLGEAEQQRLAALVHLLESGGPYDRFGLSPDAVRRAFPFFYALYRYYFRAESRGHEHLPGDGPVILAANHGGLLPFDGAMGVVDVFLHSDPPRLLRSVIERWAGTLPWVNVVLARLGQVVGTRENLADLLDEGHAVLVFPEGVAGIRKPITKRYRLQRFHPGFVAHALKSRTPIVPTAFIGSEDQAPILYDAQPLARRLGLPALPITPTFPWLGPLGLLPYPVRYRIVYGEPLRFHERFGPEAAEDTRALAYLASQVRRTVQHLVDRNR